ncbi:hypothetical protein ZHAS_00003479 [Anopheles sinensis]|uniref:Uncharacterized protein n=1 Tax=Anopheles sinensis TaxID=74873 RepID=A0A084VEP8_ANOSI|nr:hypothetical protein ZHAS_00003479 [Anopheles sinensis]
MSFAKRQQEKNKTPAQGKKRKTETIPMTANGHPAISKSMKFLPILRNRDTGIPPTSAQGCTVVCVIPVPEPQSSPSLSQGLSVFLAPLGGDRATPCASIAFRASIAGGPRNVGEIVCACVFVSLSSLMEPEAFRGKNE